MPIGVPIPVIDELIHPSLGLLSRVAVPGNPLAGPFISIHPPYTLTAHTYGVVFEINTVGAAHGYNVGSPQIYSPPLAIAAVRYLDFSGVTGMTRQVTQVTYHGQDLVWDEPLPSLLTVYLQPDVLLDLFWLQML